MRHSWSGWSVAGVAMVLVLAITHSAEAATPFYNNSGVALYNPIPGVAVSGATMQAIPVVSADRRYVTLGMQPTVSNVISIQTFPVFGFAVAGPNPNGGMVGDAGVAEADAPPEGWPLDTTASRPVVVRAAPQKGLLRQAGMTLVAEF